jgi:hypothetical protein
LGLDAQAVSISDAIMPTMTEKISFLLKTTIQIGFF